MDSQPAGYHCLFIIFDPESRVADAICGPTGFNVTPFFTIENLLETILKH
jgi:hypothetical protein